MNAFFLLSLALIARLISMAAGNQPEASGVMKAEPEVSEFVRQLSRSARHQRSLESGLSGAEVLGGLEARHLQKDLHADAAQRHQEELRNHQAAVNRRQQAEGSKRRLAALSTRDITAGGLKKAHKKAHANLKKSHLALKMSQVLKRDNLCNLAGNHNTQYCSNYGNHG